MPRTATWHSPAFMGRFNQMPILEMYLGRQVAGSPEAVSEAGAAAELFTKSTPKRGAGNLIFPPVGYPATPPLKPRKPIKTDRKSTRLNSSHRCISYAV